jgi:putative copper resistance protein D
MEESGAFAIAAWTAHFSHVIAAMLLFGASLFPFYAGTRGWPPSWTRFAPLVLASILLACGMLAAALTIADLTGDPASLARLTDLRAFFLETSFGPPWLIRLLLSVALFAIALGFAMPALLPDSRYRKRDVLLLILSAGVIVSLAVAGHARSANDGMAGIAVGSEAMHLLAAGAWIGGLPPLLFFFSELTRQSQNKTIPVLRRFSFMGQWAVAVILLGGASTLAVLMAAWKVGADGLLLSDYGVVLIVKLTLLAITLGIAGLNRFVLMPDVERGTARPGLLRKTIAAECVLGALIIAAATTLSRSPPPIPVW